MRLVQAQLQLFLGQQACLVNNLSRIGAGRDVGVASCTCCHAVRAACEGECVLPLRQKLRSYNLGDLKRHGEGKRYTRLHSKHQHERTWKKQWKVE